MIYRIGTETLELYKNGSCSLCGGAPVPFAHMVLEGKILPAVAAEPAEGGFILHFGGILPAD